MVIYPCRDKTEKKLYLRMRGGGGTDRTLMYVKMMCHELGSIGKMGRYRLYNQLLMEEGYEAEPPHGDYEPAELRYEALLKVKEFLEAERLKNRPDPTRIVFNDATSSKGEQRNEKINAPHRPGTSSGFSFKTILPKLSFGLVGYFLGSLLVALVKHFLM